jgi:excisionase family DNA binding protein
MASVVFDADEVRPVIEKAVDEAVRWLRDENPKDDSGRILLTKREAAATLGVSEATVDRLRKEKGLPCVKLDGRAMFRSSNLGQWALGMEA